VAWVIAKTMKSYILQEISTGDADDDQILLSVLRRGS